MLEAGLVGRFFLFLLGVDNGKENGNYYSILVLYRDYLGFRDLGFRDSGFEVSGVWFRV